MTPAMHDTSTPTTSTRPIRAVVLAGGNVGDTAARLQRASVLLGERGGRVVQASSLLTTEPWGFESAERFVNQAFEIETTLAPEALLDVLQSIERDLGRDRDAERAERNRTGQRYASRLIDLDLICYGDAVIRTERLTVPHPLMAEREFVLRPMCELVPAWRHPLTGRSVREMLETICTKNETKR